MTTNKPSKKKPTGSYAIGYARPPKATQFQPGQSGNPKGRPKGRLSVEEILLQEIGRLVKMKVGDQVVQVDKERALVRQLIDRALQGNLPAARLVFDLRDRAQATLEVGPDPESPLTEEELAVLELMHRQRK